MRFYNFNPQNDVSRAFRDDPSSLKYVMAVKTALNNTKKYDEFLKLLNVLRLRRNPSEYDEEFVLVFLTELRLYVYQSRNRGWVTYSMMKNLEMVVDVVVLHNIIYVVTNKANIGVLSLNSSNIKFLKLKSIPNVTFPSYLCLVNCDEQLLVIDFLSNGIKNVYKIDFSTMNYVKLETLGDTALFCALNGSNYKSKCYALSNPNRWGYESNNVYVMDPSSKKCSVYSGDDKKFQKHITLPSHHGTKSFISDWCFRHLHHEIDYSLVE
jgi:hypothetical protein